MLIFIACNYIFTRTVFTYIYFLDIFIRIF
uniref:Uncharacterized protein n=1 Tax=Anguilla anguilla TaxID=7936 RepID=A0A0E9TYB6_ANGAN